MQKAMCHIPKQINAPLCNCDAENWTKSN